MHWCRALIAAAALSATAAQGQTIHDASPAVDRWWRVQFGFDDLADVTAGDAEVQRAGINIYLLNQPSIEIVKRADKVTLTMRHLGNSRSAPIAESKWQALLQLAGRSLEPASKRDLDRATRKQRKVACHGIFAQIDVATPAVSRRLDAFSCNGAISVPALGYVDELATTAIDAIPECASVPPNDSPSLRLSNCATALGWRVTPEYRAATDNNPYPTEQTK